MRQFFNGSPSAFEDLELRASRACIVFNAEEMPATAVPQQARVGFDGTAPDGTVLLLVQKNVQYSGSSEEIRTWFQAGEKRFANFMALRCWLREELMPEYDEGAEPMTSAPAPRGPEGSLSQHVRRDPQVRSQMTQMANIGEMAKEVMSQIGDTTTCAAFKEIQTLSTIHLLEQALQASGSFSEEEKQALAKLKVELGERIKQITTIANGEIVSLLENLSPDIDNTPGDREE